MMPIVEFSPMETPMHVCDDCDRTVPEDCVCNCATKRLRMRVDDLEAELSQRVHLLETQLDELRTGLGLNVSGPRKPPPHCIACGNPCEGRGGIGHPVVMRYL